MNKITGILMVALCLSVTLVFGQQKVIWEIGKADHSSAGMALAPSGYLHFLDHDFGWEDRYYLVGFSSAEKDWPYVLPGPKDVWGGTGPTSGIRSQTLNILFGIARLPEKGDCSFKIDILGYHGTLPPLLKVLVNGKSFIFQLPQGGKSNAIDGDLKDTKTYQINIPVPHSLLHHGGNEIQLTTLDGAWLVFDQVKLTGPEGLKLIVPKNIFLRSVKAADYEIQQDGKHFQPLLVTIQHLKGKPMLMVKLDGNIVFTSNPDSARYDYEVLMPAVAQGKKSKYEVFCNGVLLESGQVERAPHEVASTVDYVDTKLGAAHSRWMIAPGPWMPFGLVKLSPDNQNSGWMGGYDPTFESIGTFSHIHEWTMAGLGTMPTSGTLQTQIGDERKKGDGYRSQIDKSSEESPLGYYKVMLTDYHIKAELTATTRCSFQRYTYPKTEIARVMIDLKIPAEYDYDLKEVTLKKVSDYRIEGSSRQYTRNAWSGGVDQHYTIHFVIEFDRPIKKFGTWINHKVSNKDILQVKDPENAGAYVEFDTRENQD